MNSISAMLSLARRFGSLFACVFIGQRLVDLAQIIRRVVVSLKVRVAQAAVVIDVVRMHVHTVRHDQFNRRGVRFRGVDGILQTFQRELMPSTAVIFIPGASPAL